MQNLKNYRGQILFYLLGIVPLVLWLINVNTASLFDSPSSSLKFVAKSAALSGIVYYCLLPILSMRHKALDTLFGGLDKVYRLHKRLAKIVFYLLWIHPVFLGFSSLANGNGFLRLWDWSSLIILSGIVCITIFSGVVYISIYAHIKHQNWVRIHRILGWLVPLFFVHAILARSQIVNNQPLLVFVVVVGFVGFMSFLYRTIFTDLHKKYPYEIVELHKINKDVIELVLKPLAFQIPYTPGQYAYVSIRSAGVDPEFHPFSFSTAPNGPYLRFVIKALGDDTLAMKHAKIGSKVLIEGAYGRFSFKRSKNKHQVWIAGGVGITPFLSMARSLSKNHPYKIHLFYAANSLDETVSLNELIDIRKLVPDILDLNIVNKEVSGFVTTELLRAELKDLKKYDYFICGPPQMTKQVRLDLKTSGIHSSQIYCEDFSI